MSLRAALAGLPLLSTLAGQTACADPGNVECQCADPSVFIAVPAERAAQVTAVVLSGVACEGVDARCVIADAADCTRYAFQAKHAGTCDVDVQFSSGPADFAAQLQFDNVGCCAGVYAPALAGATIQVPDVSQDAGSTG